MELTFKTPELGDKELIDSYFRQQTGRNCEYCFANTYLWSRHYPVAFAVVNHMLVFRSLGETEAFSFPQGKQEYLKDAIEMLMEWCREREIPFRLMLVTEGAFARLEELFPGRFQVEYDRDLADYVYEVEKLQNLSGRKYHGKKNHVNKFMSLYPDWSYEPITRENVEDCFQMALAWRQENGCEDDPEKHAEICVTLNALRLFEELEFKGGLIRTGGRVVAFTIASPICADTLDIHIEKAYADIQGAYAMINQQFLLHEGDGFTYVNREEDTGDEGLRQAKLSYRPAFMVQKGIVTEKTEQSAPEKEEE